MIRRILHHPDMPVGVFFFTIFAVIVTHIGR